MGFPLIKIPENELPLTYRDGWLITYGINIDEHIYCKENELKYGGKGGLHPGRLLGVLIRLFYDKNEVLLEKYEKLLLDNGVDSDNRIMFPYNFNYSLHSDIRNVIREGWVSGFCQGMALSYFCKRYKNEKPELLLKIRNSLEHEKIIEYFENGDIHYHEYQRQCDALNGHIYALGGLYCHWYYTGDEHTEFLLKRGIDFVLNNFEKYRNPGNASFYCTMHKVLCDKVGGKYHGLHIKQIYFLYKITNNEIFKLFSEQLSNDFKPKYETTAFR